MALFNSFQFGDVDSKDYGVYISGDSVYDSPARSVDLVQVPGRNGALALDNGYFENIEVTYPAGSFGTSQEEWREKMLGIRNALAAQRGYQKLVDTYHPDHYRLGLFLAGISASPVHYNRAGQFPIRFNCKPQRFLTSGETPQDFTKEGQETEYGPADIVSFEAKEGAEVEELVADINPIQSGSGDPSPTNIRPISGHTEAVVTRTGKNLFGGEHLRDAILSAVSNATTGEDTTGKYVTIAASSAANDKTIIEMPFEANTQYSIILKAKKSNTNSATNLAIEYTDGAVGYIVFPNGLSADTVYTFVTTTSASKTVKRIFSIWGSGTTYFYYENCGVFEGALTADDFAPYVGSQYPISLGQTVYGGTLNVTTGVLTIDRAMVDLGVLTWTYVSADTVFYASISDKKDGNANVICSAYKSGGNTGYSTPDYTVGYSTNSSLLKRIFISDPNYTTAADFKTAMSGVQLVYELATPIEYQLTPQQIATLIGTNNIWADSGQISVTIAEPVDFENPTLFPSKPLIRVYGNGTVRIGDTIITVQNNTDYIDIDCESMNCYDTTGGRNADVSFSGNDFPELASGNNGILLTGPSKVEITPRWWEL